MKSFVDKKKAKDAGLGLESNLRVSWTSGEETYALEISDVLIPGINISLLFD